MDKEIMLSRREHRAVVLAIASFVGNRSLLERLCAAADTAGLSAEDVDAIMTGGVPGERSLANIVATTYLVLDKHGALDDRDRSDVRRAGVGPLKLAEIVQLSQVDTDVFGTGQLNSH